MKHIFLAVALMASSFAVSAQDAVKSETVTHADGTTETRIPKIEQTCAIDSTGKLMNAGIGALAGYATGKVGTKMANSPNREEWSLVAAVAGGLIGANIDKTAACEKIVGYTVVRTKGNQTTTTYEAVK